MKSNIRGNTLATLLAVLLCAALAVFGCDDGGGGGKTCVDTDGDGYGENCAGGDDCDDNNADVNPGATEVCNQIDDDCDAQTDEDDVCGAACVDADNDTYGDNCAAGLDCDDSNGDVNPGATEVCNQIDDDCDAQTDEDDVCGAACVDADNDTYGDNCAAGDDCDDTDALVNPGATEVCNQKDDDCDSLTDEDDVCPTCVDGDNDGYGPGCAAGADCNDGDADIHPGAMEACDQVDNDCDDQTDEDGVCGDCVDNDNDGFNEESATCVTGDDCDDTEAAVNPGAVENPRNNRDDNCNGETDEATASPFAGDLVFNEVLLDGATDQDANGDGDIDSTDDEFAELVNTSNASIDLAGWTLWDTDQPNPRHIFPAGSDLAAGNAVVVFGGGTAPDDISGALFMVAQNTDPGVNWGLSLNNDGDVLTLYDDQMREVVTFGYGTEGIITAVQDQSVTRNPDLTGDFAAHTTASGDENIIFSPGTKVDGGNFP